MGGCLTIGGWAFSAKCQKRISECFRPAPKTFSPCDSTYLAKPPVHEKQRTSDDGIGGKAVAEGAKPLGIGQACANTPRGAVPVADAADVRDPGRDGWLRGQSQLPRAFSFRPVRRAPAGKTGRTVGPPASLTTSTRPRRQGDSPALDRAPALCAVLGDRPSRQDVVPRFLRRHPLNSIFPVVIAAAVASERCDGPRSTA